MKLASRLARLNGRFTDLLLGRPELWERLPSEFTLVLQDLADPGLSAYALEVAGKALQGAGEVVHAFFRGERLLGVLHGEDWIPLASRPRVPGRKRAPG